MNKAKINTNKIKKLFKVPKHSSAQSTALLILRIIVGLAFAFHGWGKIQTPMSWAGPDSPIPGFLLLLAAVSEFGGGIAWILGLLTPLASLGIACTMAVAIHMHMIIRGDPFVGQGGSYELASVFFAISIVLMIVGPGKFSLDRKIFGEK